MDGLGDLSTPHLADACLREGVPLRFSPPGLRPVRAGHRVAGRVCPAVHAGSVDVFLDALDRSHPGEVLVVDNGGRLDEACVGDLVALEAKHAGLAGMLVWGAHRDQEELERMDWPVWSLGLVPAGPQRLDPRAKHALERARFGGFEVTARDVAFADANGVLFVAEDAVARVRERAQEIAARERAQARRVAAGQSLRDQLAWDDFLRARRADPSRSFRAHLRKLGGSIEE